MATKFKKEEMTVKKLAKPLLGFVLLLCLGFCGWYVTSKPPADKNCFPTQVHKMFSDMAYLALIDENGVAKKEDTECGYIRANRVPLLMHTTNGGIIPSRFIRPGDTVLIVADGIGYSFGGDLYEPYWLLYQSPEA